MFCGGATLSEARAKKDQGEAGERGLDMSSLASLACLVSIPGLSGHVDTWGVWRGECRVPLAACGEHFYETHVW